MIQFKKEAREMFQKMAAHIEFSGEYAQAEQHYHKLG